ncbi:MAG: flagellar biosynthesis protein FliQ [Blastochloris viridis]|uniref:Flagellar biosynthetic protein FliQ n=1 Tax=Blastochloris viridis TaxID=1079 RepID=A0A6N4RFH8_BLAVI|nr:MAG: flagellar biosynthesis protein FliQ [Blastochloris viridis]
MSPELVATIGRETMMTLLWVSAPSMMVALVVGLVIALFQALTSIQEVTLTFVPKIILVFAVLLITMPFMASQLQQLTEDLYARIIRPEPAVVLGTGA